MTGLRSDVYGWISVSITSISLGVPLACWLWPRSRTALAWTTVSLGLASGVMAFREVWSGLGTWPSLAGAGLLAVSGLALLRMTGRASSLPWLAAAAGFCLVPAVAGTFWPRSKLVALRPTVETINRAVFAGEPMSGRGFIAVFGSPRNPETLRALQNAARTGLAVRFRWLRPSGDEAELSRAVRLADTARQSPDRLDGSVPASSSVSAEMLREWNRKFAIDRIHSRDLRIIKEPLVIVCPEDQRCRIGDDSAPEASKVLSP
ncbi:MAG: hypothetical protein MH204_07460 [Fimbriimonadaceae bacterium]|nr:hypothetical protein [Fimbriimonadaceae bacterium]